MIMTGTQSAPITPELLRGASFSRETDGYSRAEVHSLLAAAADALEVARRENEALTASLSSEDNEISSRAVLLLSQAQRIADDAVAEAESYSKDLIETARNQYREIVERAQQVAHSIERESGVRPSAEATAVDSGAPAGAPATPRCGRSTSRRRQPSRPTTCSPPARHRRTRSSGPANSRAWRRHRCTLCSSRSNESSDASAPAVRARRRCRRRLTGAPPS